jgi:glycosyltransferase involved in cell wall biosynthesis
MSIVDESRPGLTFARECGILHSRGMQIIFCDDDNWLAPNYIEQAYRLMDIHNNVAVIGGVGEAVADARLPLWFPQYQKSFACGDGNGREEGIVDYVSGAGMVLRRSAYIQLMDAGYSSLLVDREQESLSSGGDQELCYALRLLGWEVLSSHTLRFKHYMAAYRLKEEYLLKLAYGLGASVPVLSEYARFAGAKRKEGSVVKTLLPIEMFALRSIVRMLWNRLVGSTKQSLDSRVAQEKVIGSAEAYWALAISGMLRRKVVRRIEHLRSQARITHENIWNERRDT